MAGIPGIVPLYPNKNVSLLKNHPWNGVLGLLGKNCEEIMLHLLLDCGLFIQLEKSSSYYQLSGIQLVDLPLQNRPAPAAEPLENHTTAPLTSQAGKPNRSPGDIIFVRTRILYARAALNAKGSVRFGLRHIRTCCELPESRS
jgi:telomerase reverse transcriptase